MFISFEYQIEHQRNNRPLLSRIRSTPVQKTGFTISTQINKYKTTQLLFIFHNRFFLYTNLITSKIYFIEIRRNFYISYFYSKTNNNIRKLSSRKHF